MQNAPNWSPIETRNVLLIVARGVLLRCKSDYVINFDWLLNSPNIKSKLVNKDYHGVPSQSPRMNSIFLPLVYEALHILAIYFSSGAMLATLACFVRQKGSANLFYFLPLYIAKPYVLAPLQLDETIY